MASNRFDQDHHQDAALPSAPSPAPGRRTLTAALPPRAQPIQAKEAMPSGARSVDLEGASAGGGRMPAPVQAKMEQSFGTSFADVRIHEGPQASSIGALAYAQGSNVHFAPGAYDPHTTSGQELLGHELTHVVQQRAGQVATPQGKGGVINADPALEAEADVLGARAARGEPAIVSGRAVGNPMQRKGSPPYERSVTLMTKHVVLTIKHPTAKYGERVKGEEADTFTVQSIEATVNRPPVDGMDGQGQHKVAWVAIWSVLARMNGQDLDTAHATMDGIIAAGVPKLSKENPAITVTLDGSSPQKADDLLVKAHRYLVSRQADQPSWQSEDHEQLKGKGERALRDQLAHWQQLEGKDEEEDDVAALLDEKSPMVKLFDVTDRSPAEAADAAARARKELQLHNPVAFKRFQPAVDAFIAAKGGTPYGKAKKKKKGAHGGTPYDKPVKKGGGKGGKKAGDDEMGAS